MNSTPGGIHPRRLFCSASPSDIDSTSCLKPSVIAQQEKGLLPSVTKANAPLLLAPSPRSPAVLRTHVEIGLLQDDVDSLIELVKSIASRLRNGKVVESVTLTSQDGTAALSWGSDRGITVSQLEPLKEALEDLVSDLCGTSNSENNMAVQTQQDEFSSSPKSKSSISSASGMVTDSRLLSADLAHLRTIQKEVRGLFAHEKLIVDVPWSVTSSVDDPQTATKISRLLGQSEDVELTLSPTTEIFERVKTNPWFKSPPKTAAAASRRRRSGSLPNIMQDEVVISDSPISTIAPVSGNFSNREILVNDDSLTVSALQAAMARRRAPSVGRGGARDLTTWLRKQQATTTNDDQNKRRLNNLYRNFPDSSIYRN